MPRGAAAADLRPEPAPRAGGGPPPRGGSAVTNGWIAIVMMLAAETMFFTGLIGAFIVLRGTVRPWPPPDQPRLPLAVTWVNTGVLFLSAVTMYRAVAALKSARPRAARLALIETALLGATFLCIQGSEWTRLLLHGLTASSSLYGATFYTLIGVHGLHVLAAVGWLLALTIRFRGDRFSLKRAAGIELLALYWYFVCGLWAILFPLVYLI